MAESQKWGSLIRFQDTAGEVKYGEPTDGLKRATVLHGSDILHLSKSADVVEVAEVRNVQGVHYLQPY